MTNQTNHTGRDIIDISRYYENNIIRSYVYDKLKSAGVTEIRSIVMDEIGFINLEIVSIDHINRLAENAKYEFDYDIPIHQLMTILFSLEYKPENLQFVVNILARDSALEYIKDKGITIGSLSGINMREVYTCCDYIYNHKCDLDKINHSENMYYYIALNNILLKRKLDNMNNICIVLPINDIYNWSYALKLLKYQYHIDAIEENMYSVIIEIKK